MPTVQPGAKVLVTGANGYLAMWIVQKLLERGYSVRGTVRSANKGTHLEEYFKTYKDRFEVVVVPDFTKAGAIDEFLPGVSAIIHTANPVPNMEVTDPEEYIKPAVDGTSGIMKSALQSSDVKRLIYTSSLGAVAMKVDEGQVLTDKDWNEGPVKSVEELGGKASPMEKYLASKVKAEKAAWSFYEENKKASPYDFLVICPPWIFGPAISEMGSDPSNPGASSLGTWYKTCIANPEGPRPDELLADSTPYVDVRDLADVYVSALEKEDAAEERMFVVAGYPTWQQWIDAANAHEIKLSHDLPKGKPGLSPTPSGAIDTSVEERVIGMKFKTFDETLRGHMELFAKKGW